MSKEKITPKTDDDLHANVIGISDILAHLPLAIFCKDYSDNSGRFIAWNIAAEKLWGIQSSEVIGKSDADFFPTEQVDAFRKADLNTLTSGELVFIPEEFVNTPNHGQTIVRTWKVPVKSKFLLGISQDLKLQKKLEVDLEMQRAATFMAAKFASLGEIAASVAHEINNPLAVMQALTEKMLRLLATKRLDEPQIERIGASFEEMIMRVKHIVESLRRLSRDSSKDEMKLTSIATLVEESVKFMKSGFELKGITISFETLLNNHSNIICRDTEISQVLFSLLSNAKAAVIGTENPWTKVTISQNGQMIEVRVLDSGRGIPKETQSKMFDAFFTTKEIGSGKGLGLSVAKSVIENHGGRLTYDTKSANTCFLIELPLFQQL